MEGGGAVIAMTVGIIQEALCNVFGHDIIPTGLERAEGHFYVDQSNESMKENLWNTDLQYM